MIEYHVDKLGSKSFSTKQCRFFGRSRVHNVFLQSDSVFNASFSTLYFSSIKIWPTHRWNITDSTLDYTEVWSRGKIAKAPDFEEFESPYDLVIDHLALC